MKMKKFLISVLLIGAMLVSMLSSVNAANYTGGYIVNNIMTKSPTYISYEDIARLAEVATEATGKQATIVNATRFNGSDTTWIVRLAYGDSAYENAGDYVLTVFPYSWDTVAGQVVSLPFKNKEEGTALYGSSWYYFGLFDDVTHNICGFAVAERIKRWPRWDELSFSGVTYRKIGYPGSYTEPCSYQFIEEHIMKK